MPVLQGVMAWGVNKKMVFLAPPKIVVDANVLVSALLKNSVTRKVLLGNNTPQMFAPEFIKEELFKYSEEFAKRLKISQIQTKEALELLFGASKICVLHSSEYFNQMPEALQACPDKKDAPYFAVALKLGCPLWSNDLALKKQNKVTIYSTAELLKKLGQ